MDTTPILKDPWPADLDPATVPFKQRTVTVLRRRGLLDDWSKFNDFTESDVLSWWNTGAITLEDLRLTGNEAIRRHHDEEGLRRDLDAYMDEAATKPWVRHVWYHDPRFSDFLPKGDATVYDIATSGSALDQRYLWERHEALQAALDAQAGLSLVDAVSGVRRSGIRAAWSTSRCSPRADRAGRRRSGHGQGRRRDDWRDTATHQPDCSATELETGSCAPTGGDMDAATRHCGSGRVARAHLLQGKGRDMWLLHEEHLFVGPSICADM